MDNFLREATTEDCDLLFQWVNDPEVRKNSFHTEMISYGEHRKWFRNMLGSKNVRQYIYVCGGHEAGQIRLNFKGAGVLIDYSVGKPYRGKGLGTQMLRLVEKTMLGEDWNMEKNPIFIGQVEYSNIPSQRCFEKNGYHKYKLTDYIEYRKEIETSRGI